MPVLRLLRLLLQLTLAFISSSKASAKLRPLVLLDLLLHLLHPLTRLHLTPSPYGESERHILDRIVGERDVREEHLSDRPGGELLLDVGEGESGEVGKLEKVSEVVDGLRGRRRGRVVGEMFGARDESAEDLRSAQDTSRET
jgi:hypothetical protein